MNKQEILDIENEVYPKIEKYFGKFNYMVFTKNASSSEPDNFEPMMNYHKKSIALDRAYDVVHSSIIELMKEVRQIKREERKKQ